jgi:hypothetical protein
MLLLHTSCRTALAFHVVLAGGTGPVGQAVATKLGRDTGIDAVTILTRNSFLASTPNRVTEQFGWVGTSFLAKNPKVKLRDWDGGDLLDIVGQDWIGWQVDCLKSADVVVHLVGGFTPQRVLACERLVRETLVYRSNALHVSVSPVEQDLEVMPPAGGMAKLKSERVQACEGMIQANCLHSLCLHVEAYRVDKGADAIVVAIQDWAKKQR